MSFDQVLYTVSTEPRAIIIGYLIDSQQVRTAVEIFQMFNCSFPELDRRRFFQQASDIHSIIRGLEKNTNFVSTGSKPRKGNDQRRASAFALSGRGKEAQDFARFALEFSGRIGISLAAIWSYNTFARGTSLSTIKVRKSVLEAVLEAGGEVRLGELNSIVDRASDAMRHCKYLAKSGAIYLSGGKPKKFLGEKIYQLINKVSFEKLNKENIANKVSSESVQKLLDHLYLCDIDDLLAPATVFGYTNSPGRASRKKLLRTLVDNGVLEEVEDKNARVAPTVLTRIIVRDFLEPMQTAWGTNEGEYNPHLMEIRGKAWVNELDIQGNIQAAGERYLNHIGK